MRLLLLHPLPLDGSIFSDGLRALGDDCAAPTLYGCGDDLRAWGSAALDAVGDGDVVVVGNSIGGSVAIEVARLAPTKVKALVLVGAKPDLRPEPERRDECLRLIDTDGLLAAWERYWLPLFGPRSSPEAIDQGWRAASGQGPEAISHGVRAFHSRPSRGRFLDTWSGPVTIVSGEHDIRPERAQRLAERLPNATFRGVAGAGHYLPLEDPDSLTSITTEVIERLT